MSFLESSSNFKHFQKKYIVIANIFPKLETVKGLVRALSKKRCLRTYFESEHVKWSQTLVKSVLENFYHIFSSLSGKMTWKIFPMRKLESLSFFLKTLTAHEKYPV